MTDPTRLLDEGATATELAILRAGAAEEPPSDGRHKLSALLGLSAGLSASATATGTKAAVASTVKIVATKWLVFSTVGVLASGGLALYVHQSSHVASPPESGVTAGKKETPPAAPESIETEAPAVEPPVAPPRAREPSGARAATSPEQSARAGSKSIGEEIEALDGVRRALRNHAPGEALHALDGYDRAHPGGTLAQEAALLRIEALAASGDTAGARARAERFLKDNPKTPHRRRIAALLGETP
jgi:Outer membrane lipoprotein